MLLTDRLPHGDIKLCDLGFARKVYSGEDVRDIIGTPDYVGQYIKLIIDFFKQSVKHFSFLRDEDIVLNCILLAFWLKV